MRKYIDIINEATRPSKTKTPTEFDFMSSLEPEGGAVAPVAGKRDVKLPGTKAKRSRKPSLRSVDLDPDMASQISRHSASLSSNLAGHQDVIGDDEARRIAGMDDDSDDMDAYVNAPTTPTRLAIGHEPKPTTENLPAVIRKQVAETGGKVNPEWHQIKHLPNYIQQPIRVLGRAVFGQFTDTPIEDIQMIGTIGNLNSQREVVGMMDWIKRHGVRDDSAKIDFSQIMPGYEADVTLWNTEEFSFLLVHDFGGYYVYGWAQINGIYVDKPADVKKLR